MDKLTVEQRFAKVMLELRKVLPFYSALYENIQKVKSDSIKSLKVTESKIYYNPTFVDSITIANLRFIILHEILHLTLMHPCRIGGRDIVLYNVACDLYTNTLLVHELKTVKEFDAIPINQKDTEITVDLQNQCVESLYEYLYKQISSNGFKESGIGKFEIPVVDKWGNNGKAYIDIQREQDIDISDTGEDESKKKSDSMQILSNAITKYEISCVGQEHGVTTSSIQLFIEDILKSKVDWTRILKRYCKELQEKDISFKVPDKRMYYQRAIYPGLSSDNEETLQNVKICIDTSMSISETDIKYIIGQIDDIFKLYKTEAEIICWDAEIQQAMCADDINKIMKNGLCGRGGTDVKCVFNYFESRQCRIKPNLILIFTDGYFDISNMPSKWKSKYRDTIWVMTKDYNKQFKQPFGKIAIAEFV